MAAIYPGVGIELHSPVRTLARECYLPRNTADTIDVGCDPQQSKHHESASQYEQAFFSDRTSDHPHFSRDKSVAFSPWKENRDSRDGNGIANEMHGVSDDQPQRKPGTDHDCHESAQVFENGQTGERME